MVSEIGAELAEGHVIGDPFAQVFGDDNMAKLKARPLAKLGEALFTKAEALGAKFGDDTTFYYGAASIALFQAGWESESLFFKHMLKRLAEGAAKSQDLQGFLRTLFPDFTCDQTPAGYKVFCCGLHTFWPGRVSAKHFVDLFLGMEGCRWRAAALGGDPELHNSFAPQDEVDQLPPLSLPEKRSRTRAFLDKVSPNRAKRRSLQPTPSPVPDRHAQGKQSAGRSFMRKLGSKKDFFGRGK